MYHIRPRYLNLKHLQTTFKLSYLGCGPTDQSCANMRGTCRSDAALVYSKQLQLAKATLAAFYILYTIIVFTLV